MHWYLHAWRHYADFSGRARREAFWHFSAVQIAITMALGAVDLGLEFTIGVTAVTLSVTWVRLAYAAASLLPGIALTVRRLHDTGRSGWMLLPGLFPIFGWIVFLFWMLEDSYPGTNEFGPNSKAVAMQVTP